jgi:hypothetical protein
MRVVRSYLLNFYLYIFQSLNQDSSSFAENYPPPAHNQSMNHDDGRGPLLTTENCQLTTEKDTPHPPYLYYRKLAGNSLANAMIRRIEHN